MLEEDVPYLVVIVEFVLVFGGLWLYRRRKLSRMTPSQRAYYLEAERRPVSDR